MRRASAFLVPVLLAAAWLAPAPSSARPKPPPLAGLDAYVARAMKEFGVPGMAVAVVKDGQVVLAKGYGVRRAGEPGPVDADTLFAIASNTKAFTCAALSILVEDGTLAWDDPVTKHLPALPDVRPVGDTRGHGARPRDPPRRPRPRRGRPHVVAADDLHAGRDRAWHPPPEAGLELPQPLRLQQRHVRDRGRGGGGGRRAGAGTTSCGSGSLSPLGMSRTDHERRAPAATTWPRRTSRSGAWCGPVAVMTFDNAGAAAAVNSSASDMARWVRMLLECGRQGRARRGRRAR